MKLMMGLKSMIVVVNGLEVVNAMTKRGYNSQ